MKHCWKWNFYRTSQNETKTIKNKICKILKFMPKKMPVDRHKKQRRESKQHWRCLVGHLNSAREAVKRLDLTRKIAQQRREEFRVQITHRVVWCDQQQQRRHRWWHFINKKDTQNCVLAALDNWNLSMLFMSTNCTFVIK